jgi:hypothetical protein
LSVYSTSSASSDRSNARVHSMSACKAALASYEAAIKWLLLVIVGLLECGWMAFAGFQIGSGYLQALGFTTLLISISFFYSYTGRDERIAGFAHFGAQYLSLLAALMTLSYLAVSTNAPLADRDFDAMDKAMGLDWVAWTKWVIAHPTLRWGLSLAYDSLPYQAFFCFIYNVHTRANWRNSEIWWIVFTSAVVTIAGSAEFPGTNPYVYYGIENADHFLHMKHFLALRDGTLRVIILNNAQGLIQLPSFHTVLAIMLTYNLRQNRWLFAASMVLNAALILSCPTEGSHYFIDLLAGAIVAAITILVVRAMTHRLHYGSPRVCVSAPR